MFSAYSKHVLFLHYEKCLKTMKNEHVVKIVFGSFFYYFKDLNFYIIQFLNLGSKTINKTYDGLKLVAPRVSWSLNLIFWRENELAK